MNSAGAQTVADTQWEAQLRKGTLEMAVLASLWKGRLYGLEVLRYLETHARLALAEGTVYPLLSRLKAEALVVSEWVEADAGHPRKYYALTDAGRARVRFMAESWVLFTGGVSQLLGPVLLPAGAARPVLLKQKRAMR